MTRDEGFTVVPKWDEDASSLERAVTFVDREYWHSMSAPRCAGDRPIQETCDSSDS